MHSVAIFGASGYAGLELMRLLSRHPAVEVVYAGSERFVGRPISDLAPWYHGSLRAFSKGDAPACDLVCFATPPESAREHAQRFLDAGSAVIDLSHEFRASPRAVYGLPELNRAAIAEARFIANPGCYPTAANLALGPLLRAGAIANSVIVDAMSGVTGAGRKADEAYSFVELAGNAKAYRVLRHQHQPEIAATLGAFAGAPVDTVFTPHLIPIARGILSTAYATATRPTSAAELIAILRDAYATERFVRVVDSADDVEIAKVVGTNDCVIGVACEGTQVVVVSAIDNLVKGAAGQAVQNLNLVLGHPEETAL